MISIRIVSSYDFNNDSSGVTIFITIWDLASWDPQVIFGAAQEQRYSKWIIPGDFHWKKDNKSILKNEEIFEQKYRWNKTRKIFISKKLLRTLKLFTENFSFMNEFEAKMKHCLFFSAHQPVLLAFNREAYT